MTDDRRAGRYEHPATLDAEKLGDFHGEHALREVAQHHDDARYVTNLPPHVGGARESRPGGEDIYAAAPAYPIGDGQRT